MKPPPFDVPCRSRSSGSTESRNAKESVSRCKAGLECADMSAFSREATRHLPQSGNVLPHSTPKRAFPRKWQGETLSNREGQQRFPALSAEMQTRGLASMNDLAQFCYRGSLGFFIVIITPRDNFEHLRSDIAFPFSDSIEAT